MSQTKSVYLSLHLVRTFFEDLSAWKKVSHLAGISSKLSQLDYDFLFRGTAADIYVPVWASACISGMDILLNEITLEVILFYKQYGYEPSDMDGNPPDYIGQQFRFLEYLTRCAMQGDKDAADAAMRFIDDFTLDTLRVMGEALRRYTDDVEVMSVLELAMNCLNGHGIDTTCEILRTLDSWHWERKPAIPAEEPHTVSHASFSDCGGRCKMLSTVREGCVLAIRPDQMSAMRFSGCPRGAAYRPTFLSSRRLRYPMERVGKRGEGRFRRISWEEAVDKVTDVLRVSKAEGPGSRYVMAGAGVCGVLQGSELTKRLLDLDGGRLGYYSTYSIGCALPVLPRMFGEIAIANHETEILHSKLLLLWGNNLVTNHFGSAQKRMLMLAKERGIRIIVIDPRQSDTVLAAADQWIAIRPGTDSALADAMCWVIWQEKLYDKDFVDRFCVGFDDEHLPEGVPAGESYVSYLSGVKDGIEKTPEWAEKVTGIPADTIHQLAVEYATARYACILPGLGPQRTLNGEQTYRNILTLACLTGGLAKPGGGIITWTRPGSMRPVILSGENPYPLSIPAFQWWRAAECPETMTVAKGLQGGEHLEGPVRYLFSIASGMLLNQHSDINHTLRLLQDDTKIQKVILADLFMTPSARGADLVLPAPSFFETENISPPWAGEDYVLYNHAAIAPLFESRLELEWLRECADRLGLAEAFTQGWGDLRDWLRHSWEEFREKTPSALEFDRFFADSITLLPDMNQRIRFWENIEEGVPFKTPSGKIEIFLRELYDRPIPNMLPTPGYVATEEGSEDPMREKYPLQLIGYHSKRRCHSIHDGNPWLEELEPPCVWIHPTDARERGIQDGQMVEVFNDRGRIRIPAKVTSRIVSGVTAMSEGGWFTPDKEGNDTRGSINVLTMSHRATPLGNANPQHTNLVEIKPTEG